jgi:hypothetical protein
MASLETLAPLPRRHILTYHDTQAPGAPGNTMLPVTGTLAIFRLQTGPKPIGRKVQVVLGFEALQETPFLLKPPSVRVNSVLCTSTPQVQNTALTYDAPDAALAGEAHTIEVESTDGKPFKVIWVEIKIAGEQT